MGRRRVLALGPAMSRMMCMQNPYRRVRKGEEEGRGQRRSWFVWRRKKTVRLGGGERSKRPRRRWGLRVGRLRIRWLSPMALLKRLCDAYVRMMFALEDQMGSAGIQCAAAPPFALYPMHMPGRMSTSYDISIYDFAAKVK